MKNRDKVLRMNEHDLLLTLQNNLFDAAITKKYICVLDALDGCDRDCDSGGCSVCIQKWLNEEAAK